MKRNMEEKGITLVALVITTIVLLILAGVVVKLSIGDNGVVSRTKDAASKYDASQSYEMGLFNDIANEYDQIIAGNWSIGGSGGNQGGGNSNTTPGGGDEGGDNPDNPGGSGNLSETENDKLTENGIKELSPSEITNDNLKNNENIKAVITGEVPIPTGGEYKEGTKDTGVVVAMGESEFVWVPVPDIAEMAVLQSGSTTNYQGVLYDFTGTTATEKTNYGIGTTDCREPDILRDSADGDTKVSNLAIMNNILGTNYTAASQFMMDLQGDFNKMVASVIKYKGFFIGRYEVSIDVANQRAYSKVGVLPATAKADSGNTWYGLYSYQKKMAEANGYTSVESHMIWRLYL